MAGINDLTWLTEEEKKLIKVIYKVFKGTKIETCKTWDEYNEEKYARARIAVRRKT